MSVKGGDVTSTRNVRTFAHAPEFSTAETTAAGIGGLATGSYYSAGNAMNGPNAVFNVDVISAVPFYPCRTGVLDSLMFLDVVNGAAGAVARQGIYDSTPRGVYPNRLLFDSGPIATDAGPVAKISALASGVRIIEGRLYWFVLVAGVAAFQTTQVLANSMYPLYGWSQAFGVQLALAVAFPFAALPAQFPAGANVANFAQWQLARFTTAL